MTFLRKLVVSAAVSSLMVVPAATSALTLEILGVQPASKVISDTDTLRVYWRADTSGTYSISVSSQNMTSRYVDDYRDLPYNAGISYSVTLTPLEDLENDGYTVDDVYYLTVEFSASGSTVDATVSTSFILDNPPEAPSNVRATPGDKYVLIEWDRHRDNDIKEFRVYYDITPSPYPSSPTEADYDNVKVVEGRESTGIEINDLFNGETYYFSVQAVDAYGNRSEFSAEISATPQYEMGFSSFSDEDVGCIIARTAGRDTSLSAALYKLRKIVGNHFPGIVKSYYAFSAVIAVFEHHRPFEGTIVRYVLFAFVASAGFIYSVPAVLPGALLAIVIGLSGIRRSRSLKVLLLAGIVFFSTNAHADSPMNFYMNLKAGNMKFSKTALKERWWEIYGPGGHTALMGDLGYEIPWKRFGTWVLNGTAGIFWESGYGLVEQASGEIERGGKDLEFYLVPLGIGVTYLARFLKQQYVIPFGGVGITGYFFSESKKNGETIKKGRVGGYYYSVGALFNLDWVEPEYALKLDADSGINHSYILLEYRWSIVDEFGKYSDFDFSNNTFFAGLAFEF